MSAADCPISGVGCCYLAAPRITGEGKGSKTTATQCIEHGNTHTLTKHNYLLVKVNTREPGQEAKLGG